MSVWKKNDLQLDDPSPGDSLGAQPLSSPPEQPTRSPGAVATVGAAWIRGGFLARPACPGDRSMPPSPRRRSVRAGSQTSSLSSQRPSTRWR